MLWNTPPGRNSNEGVVPTSLATETAKALLAYLGPGEQKSHVSRSRGKKKAKSHGPTKEPEGPSESHVPPSAPTMQVQDVKHRTDLYSPYSMAKSKPMPVTELSQHPQPVQTAEVSPDKDTAMPPIMQKPSNEVEAMLATRAVPKEGAKPGEYFPSTSSSSTLPSSTAPTLVLPVAAVEIAAEKPIKDTCMTKTIQRRASTHKSSEAVLLASRASMLRSKSLKETPIDCESLGMLLTTRPTQLRSESMTVRIADVPKRVLTLAGIGCASLILLVAVLVFVVVSGPGYLVCVTAACKLYSSLLAKALAPSGNPCNDFHHYVCATWEANNKMSLHKYVLSGFLHKVSSMASNPVFYKDRQSAVQKAAVFYQSCFAVLKDDLNHLRVVKNSLLEFGVFWPELNNQSNALEILFSVASAWNWGSPVHFFLNRPGVLEAKPAVLFGVTMKKSEAMMLQGASENKTYYQRFFEKLAEDFSRPGAKATSYEEHRNIESRVLQRLEKIYWMKNFTTVTNTSVEEVITLSNYSIRRSDWDKKLSAHFNVTPGGFDAYSFTIYNTEFFGAFFQMLSSDEETAIAYYVGWCIVQVVSQLATKELIQYSYTNHYEAIIGHEDLCSTMTLNYFGLPFYAGYMSGYIRPLTISRAHKIFKNAKTTFGTALERSDFKKFFAPLSGLSIGSETSIVELVRKRNEYVLNSMYMSFPDMKQSIWSNIPEATHARRITELNETLLDYIDVDLQAVYRLRKQHVQLLPIAFEAPFYDDDTIAAANYGALGSEMASGLATLIITIMNMSANDTFAKLGSNSSCLATSQLTSTAASHPLPEKNNLELLVRSTALRMTYYAYFAGDRDWRDYRLSGYTQLTDKKLLFIFWCLLQCGKPDAKFKCNGPVEAFKSFGTAFGCSPGDPMHSGRDCVALI